MCKSVFIVNLENVAIKILILKHTFLLKLTNVFNYFLWKTQEQCHVWNHM